MDCKTNTFITNDGEEIFYYHYKCQSPKAIIQIAHGVGEHAGRYQPIASLLQDQGFEVYANDHRIHGNSVKSKDLLGFYDGPDYFNDAIEDMHELTKIIKNEHPHQKIILFGHSMGSLLSREYVTRYGELLHALALSGTASFMKGLGNVGLVGAHVTKFFRGRERSSTTLKSLFFTEFNKKFKPNRTKVDWISRDQKQVDLFESDPLRIEDFSTSVFIDILKGSKKINQKPTFEATPKNLPIYIFSGDKDPVGEMGKGIKKVAKQYKNAGISDITLKLYEGGRHEMLNEINREEVESDFINWLNERIESKN